MLAISRRAGESFLIGDNTRIKVVRINGDKVRIGIEAPEEIKVVREELVKKEGRDERSTI